MTGELPPSLGPGSDANGLLIFPGGVERPVEGVVVRSEAREFALHFTTLWLEREIILGEKRRLRLARRTRENE